MDFDPMSPQTQAEPYAFFRAGHAGCPVHHHRLSDDDVTRISGNPLVAEPTTGFYSVLRHDDLKAVAQDHELFSSAQGPGPERLLALNGVGMLVYADEPHHRMQRRIVNKALSPRMVSLVEPRIREVCNELVDAVYADGRAEMVTAYANEVPGTIFSELLGVPPEDRKQFKRWAEEIVAAFGGSPEAQLQSVETMNEISAYFIEIIDQRRAELAHGRELPDDLLTAMLVNDYEGRTFDDTDLILAIHVFLVGGHETTASGIAGTIHQLAVHPEQRDLLLADRSLLSNAVEEILRFESPVQGLFRTTKADTEVAGTPIAAQEKVRLVFASANRDPAVFDDPDTFDVTRDPRKLRHHLAFGTGNHACVGAALARLELQIALETLLDRLGSWELDPERPAVRGDSLLVRRFAELPVCWTPRS